EAAWNAQDQGAIAQRAEPVRVPREVLADKWRQLLPGLALIAGLVIDLAGSAFWIKRIAGPEEAQELSVPGSGLGKRPAAGPDRLTRDHAPGLQLVARSQQHQL